MKEFEDRFDGLSAEQKREFNSAMEAHATKIMNATFDPAPPAPDGFAHWPSQPHGAADIFSPHLAAPMLNEGDEGKSFSSLDAAIKAARERA